MDVQTKIAEDNRRSDLNRLLARFNNFCYSLPMILMPIITVGLNILMLINNTIEIWLACLLIVSQIPFAALWILRRKAG